jgi:hypothetical protein
MSDLNAQLDKLIAELKAANQDVSRLVFEVRHGVVVGTRSYADAFGLSDHCERCRRPLAERGTLCDDCLEELRP